MSYLGIKNKIIKIGDEKIFTRANSQFWQCELKLKNGRVMRKSTGIRISEDPSGERAVNFADNLRNLKKGTVKNKVEDAYKAFSKAILDDCGYKPVQLSLKQCISKYLQSFDTRIVADGTKRLYQNALCKFEEFIGKDALIESIDFEQFESFKKYLLENFARETAKSTFNNVKVFFRFLHTNKFIAENIVQGVKGVEQIIDDKEMRTYTEEEFEKIIESTRGTYWETMTYIARYTGQREMDIFNLTWEQIDLSGDGKIEFHIQKTKNRGRYKHIQPFIFQRLRNYLNSLPDKHGRLFKFKKKQSTLSTEFHDILLRLQIVKKPEPESQPIGKRKHKSDLTFHSFRKTLSHDMKEMGYSADFRAEFIGHTEEINESNYTKKFDDSTVQAKLKEMDNKLYNR